MFQGKDNYFCIHWLQFQSTYSTYIYISIWNEFPVQSDNFGQLRPHKKSSKTILCISCLASAICISSFLRPKMLSSGSIVLVGNWDSDFSRIWSHFWNDTKTFSYILLLNIWNMKNAGPLTCANTQNLRQQARSCHAPRCFWAPSWSVGLSTYEPKIQRNQKSSEWYKLIQTWGHRFIGPKHLHKWRTMKCVGPN